MGGVVFKRTIHSWPARALLVALTGVLILHPLPGSAQQDEISRKVKNRITPNYPDLARRMSVAGVVKVQVVVAPNGSVKSTKVIGGHPLLVNAAVDAVKKWRFETASEETTGIVEFKFDPNVANQ